MSKTTRVKEELSQLETNWSRKSTYPGDVVLLLPMELRGMLEVGVYRAAEVELLLPDLSTPEPSGRSGAGCTIGCSTGCSTGSTTGPVAGFSTTIVAPSSLASSGSGMGLSLST